MSKKTNEKIDEVMGKKTDETNSKEAHKSDGKFLALILRHKPEAVGISLDNHGWADVEELIDGISKTRDFSLDVLEEIVATDSKHRYSFNEDHSKIRANQGHSVNVDVELVQKKPPDVLYHGTAQRFIESILKIGLVPNGRLYVHLSKDKETAIKVGQRHGKPAVLEIDSRKMSQDGIAFYLSENGVWLVKKVPVEYISIVD